jgi:mono/diheme cytochrome c family protein
MMSRAIRVLLACLLLAALLIATALAVPGLTEPAWAQETSTTATPPQPLAGAASYAQNCAPCHGETGLGDGPSASGLSVPPAKLGDDQLAAAKSLAEWFDITKNGNMQRMMPPWKDRLTDQEIWDTVAYSWDAAHQRRRSGTRPAGLRG